MEDNEVKSKFSGIKKICEGQYKKLLIIPFTLLLIAIVLIGLKIAVTGDFINRDVSLKGGVTVTIPTEQQVDISQLKNTLSSRFPENDISTKSISQFGAQVGIIVEADIGEEGDPLILFRKRTDSFAASAKELCISTPTLEGISRIEREYNLSDQSEYYVPCPKCKKKQTLEFGTPKSRFGLKWTKDVYDKLIDIYYQCKFCKHKINEGNKTWMLDNGEWIAKYPERSSYHRGFHLNSLYSPLGWVSWEIIIKEFLSAKKTTETLKAWVNTRLGLPFKIPGTTIDWIKIKTRAEPYHVLEVPNGGLFLTAGVDVQQDRISIIITAWGRGEECWVIWWGELYGIMENESGDQDTTFDKVWRELDDMLMRGYKHVSGAYLHISCVAIDSGHRTQEVYNYVRHRTATVIAIKGQSIAGKPLIGHPTYQDLDYKGEIIKAGVQLWPIGADTAKALVYSRLSIEEKGPGYIHTPIGLPDMFYEQLTAEKLVTKLDKQTGHPKQVWVLPAGARNEALDCMNYSFGAAIRVGLHHMDWAKLESGLGTEIKRSQDQPVEERKLQLDVPQKKKPKRRSRSSFISNTTLRS